MLNLRPYQQTAITNIIADWKDFQRVLLMAATGTGKTVMFLATMAEILRTSPSARILVLAHRRELIYQPIERAASMFPALAFRMGVVMADKDDVRSQIVVATVQSLTASATRLARVLEHGPIEYVIIDEAHHATAETYLKVIRSLGNPKVLGCTATPKRSDNLPLGDVFQKVSFRISIQDAIKQGALVPFTPLGFQLPADASGIKQTADGWEDEPMGELLSAANILEIVHTKWLEFAGNRQTIGFTASVAQAHATAAYFNSKGIKAAAIDGTTPKGERDQVLRKYQAGGLQAIFNCMVLTEGFDAPETACVMMIAPTRSDLIYVQRLGRGLRTAKGKVDCMVLDFAPMGARDVVMAGDVLEGVPTAVRKIERDAVDAGVMTFGWKVDDDGGIQAIDPFEIKAMVLNYLSHHRLAWSFDGAIATASLGEDGMIAILPPEQERLAKADELRRAGRWDERMGRVAEWIGKFRLYQIKKVVTSPDGTPPEKQHYTWVSTCIGDYDSLAMAKDKAEELSYGHNDTLSRRRSEWRTKPMSDSQASYLRKLGAYRPGLTSGQAAQAITHALAMRQVRTAEQIKQRALLGGV